MWNVRFLSTSKRVLSAGALAFAIFAAGCDDRVQIIRDRDVRIPQNATWAWRPVVQETAATRTSGDNRPVISRDDVSRQGPPQRVVRDAEANNEVVRGRVKTAIEQTLMSRGFKQVTDPAAADFLVDYKFAVNRGNVAVPVYGGGYGGLVCGPFRCWDSWGYGPAYVGYENVHFREGTIVFDLVQAANNHQVYRAIGEKPVRRDAFSLTQDEINELTRHLLKDLKTGK
jgi:hypothetical protein